ncbi:enoyl-CoA hydratase [uncultured Rhodoblastus sp.]|uniref:enoyl-CoA hydratase n=1 Tax=uncultured Rhodoblastus sp. TaxID=543037 RepID=UPI0025E113DC|nr:enoyl-CoA hydratase [uncultured Rhodoblastus sp.]
MKFENIIVEVHDTVGLIRLNRPKALNALNSALISELNVALDGFEKDRAIGALVLTGSDKAFAAGADIKELQALTYMDAYLSDTIASWERLSYFRKPAIAAVAGFALGGGCELAMMCDYILAAENAQFGQPEIKLGIMPGAGGTQRLARAVGKAKAMEMCLTGRLMDAREAEKAGLVARIVPAEKLVEEAMAAGKAIADKSLPIAMQIKDCINSSQEMTLTQGVKFERRNFHAAFATQDQKEGMAAFIEKRTPRFSDR